MHDTCLKLAKNCRYIYRLFMRNLPKIHYKFTAKASHIYHIIPIIVQGRMLDVRLRSNPEFRQLGRFAPVAVNSGLRPETQSWKRNMSQNYYWEPFICARLILKLFWNCFRHIKTKPFKLALVQMNLISLQLVMELFQKI